MSNKSHIWHIPSEKLCSGIVAFLQRSELSSLAGRKETMSLNVCQIRLVYGARFSSRTALKYAIYLGEMHE